MPLSNTDAKLGADTLPMLAVDAVERAGCGHPGMPMGAADYAFALWHDHLIFDPSDPAWPNRDRFILSAGHGSMLLYGLLHLFGFDLPMQEIENFRQWASRTPGHPEAGLTPGVEVTTGPLGQGFANGVGLALAARMAAARFNDDLFHPINHRIYGIISDGDMMEGISSEAASLAGHLKLGNLIYLYDDNRITIEGETSLAFSEDVAMRFEAYGWQVQQVDGHDYRQISLALEKAKDEESRPSLIIAHTHIGHGSPGKHDSPAVHGSPLGAVEAIATRQNLEWPDTKFYVPESVREICRRRVAELQDVRRRWLSDFAEWQRRNPEKARLWDQMWDKKIPTNIAGALIEAIAGAEEATRSVSGKTLQKVAELVPSLVGGSADLEPSTNTFIFGSASVSAVSTEGRNLHFGVREHAMAAIMNGFARYGCFIPYGSTFLTFSDYCRPSIRLSALMGLQVVYVFTHDSILLGEDGPTHQPVEQLSSLRLIPNLQVIRPADAIETAMAWAMALERSDGPTALILTRQKLPAITRNPSFDPAVISRGGYPLQSGGDKPDVVIMASGSEVNVALAAARLLTERKISARVLSVPCMELFLAQDTAYRRELLPPNLPNVAIEAGRGGLWYQVLGDKGLFVGVETFGASAPEKVLAEKFGLTPEKIAERIVGFLQE